MARTAAHLSEHQFTRETASLAGRRGAETRAATRAAKRLSSVETVETLRALATAANGVDIPTTCIGVAMYALGRVVSGAVPIRHAGDAAELVRVLVDVARLTSGQSTSHAVVAHLTSADARARLAELAELASGVLDVTASSAAVAADDPPVADGAPRGCEGGAGTPAPAADGGSGAGAGCG